LFCTVLGATLPQEDAGFGILYNDIHYGNFFNLI